MAKTFYFISGLPRAGSTLLSALLNQNPRFHAGISSPVAPMCNSLLNIMGAGNEYATRFSEEQKRDVLRGLFENYYTDLPEGSVVFDSHRSWCGRLALLHQLFDHCKVICCVRNVAWIMDSFERLVQKQPHRWRHTWPTVTPADPRSRNCAALFRSYRKCPSLMRPPTCWPVFTQNWNRRSRSPGEPR